MKKYLTVSNIIYGVSMLFAISVMAKVYYDRSQLPAGVCPITNNNIWVYSAIGVLLVSIVVTSILDRRSKKAKQQEEENISS